MQLFCARQCPLRRIGSLPSEASSVSGLKRPRSMTAVTRGGCSLGSCYASFVGYPAWGLGFYNHKVGYP